MSRLYLQHPEDDQLLAYSDGELHGLAGSRIRKHLKECWRCRTQLEDLQSTVSTFMRYNEHELQPNLPAPPAEWKSLAVDFERIDRATPPPSLVRRVASQFAGKPVRVAMAAAVVCVAGLAYWTNNTPAPSATPPVEKSAPEARPMAPPFAPTARPVDATTATPIAPAAPSAIPIPEGNAELKVIAALHRAGADLGEPIEIARDQAGLVTVTGLAIPPARREEVKSALSAVPGVRLRWEETTTPATRSRQAASIQAHPLPWQAELESALGSREQLEQFTNQALDSSDRITARAYAIRALEARFAAASLSATERTQLAAIVADHRRELKSAARTLRATVKPVFEGLGGKIQPAQTRPALFETARAVDQSLNIWLAGAGSARTLDEILPELGKALGDLMKVAED